MDKNKIALGALALDLKRVALGKHHGSMQMAERFYEEALKRKSEIDQQTLKPYMRDVLKMLDKEVTSDDALMLSTLIQNYVVKQD